MNFIEIIEMIQAFFKNPAVQWLLWTVASIVMLFTPDNVDKIILSILSILGIKGLIDTIVHSSGKH